MLPKEAVTARNGRIHLRRLESDQMSTGLVRPLRRRILLRVETHLRRPRPAPRPRLAERIQRDARHLDVPVSTHCLIEHRLAELKTLAPN